MFKNFKQQGNCSDGNCLMEMVGFIAAFLLETGGFDW
jgi:hypothetical protein